MIDLAAEAAGVSRAEFARRLAVARSRAVALIRGDDEDDENEVT